MRKNVSYLKKHFRWEVYYQHQIAFCISVGHIHWQVVTFSCLPLHLYETQVQSFKELCSLFKELQSWWYPENLKEQGTKEIRCKYDKAKQALEHSRFKESKSNCLKWKQAYLWINIAMKKKTLSFTYLGKKWYMCVIYFHFFNTMVTFRD